jgi:hypothetical protein
MASPPTRYEITLLDQWEAVVEGDADGDGTNGKIFEIKGGRELRDLPDPSREAMLGAVAHFGGSLLATLERDSRTSTQIQERATVAAELFDLLLRGSADEVESLIDALKPLPSAEGDNEIDLQAAEDRARLRMKAIFFRAIEDSFTVAQLRDELELSRQRVKQLRDEDRLFAIDVPYERSLLYPRWQFDSSGRPRAQMPALIRAARDSGLDALGFHLLMTGRRDEEPSGVQMLRDGDEDRVLALVRAADR